MDAPGRSYARQHAEAGADLIEEEQDHVRQLAPDLGLTTVRILREASASTGLTRAGSVEFTPDLAASE